MGRANIHLCFPSLRPPPPLSLLMVPCVPLPPACLGTARSASSLPDRLLWPWRAGRAQHTVGSDALALQSSSCKMKKQKRSLWSPIITNLT